MSANKSEYISDWSVGIMATKYAAHLAYQPTDTRHLKVIESPSNHLTVPNLQQGI